MDIDFQDAAKPDELSNFALSQSFYRRAGFSNPLLSFNVTRELVVPDMASIGTDKLLSTVLAALSSDRQNIHTDDIWALPQRPEREREPSLRDQIFTATKNVPMTGTASNPDLATILNKLARLGEPEDPIQRMRRAETGRDVLHLPVHPRSVAEEKRLKEKLQQGETFKEKTHFVLVRELQRLLYDNRGPIDSRLQNATYELPLHLVDGDRVQKALYEVIDHFGSVGDLVRNGFSLGEAVAIRKRMQENWAQNSLKKDAN